MEAVLFEHVMQAEEKGFDAVIVGCCYDPGVRVARELVDIPVIGPMEASLQMAGYHGYNYTVVTDHHKAAPWIEDVIRLSGLDGKYQGIRTIEWYIRDMINDPDAVARDTIARCEEVVKETHVDTIVMGCTIVAACFQRYLMKGGRPPRFAIMNPNLMALKMAESLADLKQMGGYHISRAGFYEQPNGFYGDEFRQARKDFGRSVKHVRDSKD
jgi:allantoin racemase